MASIVLADIYHWLAQSISGRRPRWCALRRTRHRIGDAGFDQASWKVMDCAASSVRWHARTIDPESADWLAALEGAAPARDAALGRLHALLLRVARSEAARRAPAIGLAGPELDDLTQQAADDALVGIVAKLGEFRGDSRFTTWAYKFAVLEVAGKLTRHAWRKTAPSRLEEDWTLLPDRFGFGPAEATEWAEMFALLRRAVDEDLSPRQRRVFVAIALQGVPLDVLVQELGSNRNAIYKSLFDARRKLRARLVANGYMDDLARRA
jgi:RNA polymerase sigma-70 factor (ECF subfamily)